MKNASWKLPIIIGVSVVTILTAGIFIVQSYQNQAFALEEKINSSKSDINVQENRKWELIGDLVDCVKQYDEYEYNTLTAIVDKRTEVGDTEGATAAIAAIVEAYPELKSSENYKHLMNELSMTENLLAEYRSNYNKQIENYNRYVKKFPTRSFLDLLGYERQDYIYLEYEIPEETSDNLFD